MLFKKVMVGAFFYVYEKRIDLSKALLLPFTAYLIIGFAEEIETEWSAYYYLLFAVSFLIQTIFAITTHRIILLGKGSVPEWGLHSWRKRETFFLIHALVLVGSVYILILTPALILPPVLMLPPVLHTFIPVVVMLIVLIFIFWVWGRFSLVFPGIAIDKGVSFKMSWSLTKKYQLMMLLVVIVFPILLAIPSILLSYIPYTAVFTNLISILVIVFEVAALSIAYQLITMENMKMVNK